eukprot:1975557-Prymnesium_polylepis.1
MVEGAPCAPMVPSGESYELDHVIARGQMVDVVRDEDDGRRVAHLGVDGGEDVVEDDGRRDAAGGRVARARECNAGLLPSGQVDASLANLAAVATRELLQVGGEGAAVEDAL